MSPAIYSERHKKTEILSGMQKVSLAIIHNSEANLGYFKERDNDF